MDKRLDGCTTSYLRVCVYCICCLYHVYCCCSHVRAFVYCSTRAFCLVISFCAIAFGCIMCVRCMCFAHRYHFLGPLLYTFHFRSHMFPFLLYNMCLSTCITRFSMLLLSFAKICGVACATVAPAPPTTLVVRTPGLSIEFDKATAAPVSVKVKDLLFCVIHEFDNVVDQYLKRLIKCCF